MNKKGDIRDPKNIDEYLRIFDILDELDYEPTFIELVAGDRWPKAFTSYYIWESLRNKLHSISMPLNESAYLYLTNLMYTLEGPFSFVMNAVIYTLMHEGHHDIWSEQEQKFITTFDEVFYIPLSTRLKFLNAHGFTVFSEICPRRLRNAIAHQNFTIDSDGSIRYKRTKKEETTKTISELDRIINRMIGVIDVFIDVLGEV